MEEKQEYMSAKSFKDLIVWQRAHSFVIKVYDNTKTFPKDELYGLTSQFRRAAVSIAANIAEGFAKKSKIDKLRFFNISQGSLEECRYYIILSNDLTYISEEERDMLDSLADSISKILLNYIQKIRDDINDKQ